MQNLLLDFVSERSDPLQKHKVLLQLADACNNRDDVLFFVALYRQLDTNEHNEALEMVIQNNTKRLDTITVEILVELIKQLDSARPLVYKYLAAELADAHDDAYRLETQLNRIHLISIEDKDSMPEFFVEKLWSLLLVDEDAVVNSISRILNLKMYDGTNTDEWFGNIVKRIKSPTLGELPGYRCWLSWLQHGPSLKLHKYMQTTEYWGLILKGITDVPRSTERIKNCLSILDLSLKGLESPVDLEIMKWNPQSKLCRSLWVRYAALVEIISVDLSHNQAEESRGDIIALCQDLEFIPAIWALALLQSGLTTSAENIRNLICDIVLHLPNQDLFNYSPGFLVTYLLPLVCDASKFDVENQEECKYIDELDSFMRSLSGALEPEKRMEFLDHLLKAYQAQVYAYDLPRVIILNAILSVQICAEPLDTFLDLATYANGARRVAKSQVIGQMIFDACLKGIKSLDLPQALEVLPKFFSSIDTYDRLDLALEAFKNPTASFKQKLVQLAKSKGLFYILHMKLAEINQWSPLDLIEHPEATEIVNTLNYSCFQQSISDKAITDFEKLGFVDQSTMKALLLTKAHPRLENSSADGLANALGDAQKARLMADGYSSFDELEVKELTSGYLTGSERAMNAKRISNIVQNISPVKAMTGEQISILARCFGHDYLDTQRSILDCMRRFLDSNYPIDTGALSEALETMWNLLIENGLKAVNRELHIEFIDVFMHKRLFVEKACEKNLATIASSIVSHSHARKNLLCPLMRKFYERRESRLPPWAFTILVEAYTLIRTRHDVFYLEDILKSKYMDKTPFNAKFWPENERHARVLAIKTLECQDQAEEIAECVLSEHYHLFDILNSHDGVEENIRILCYQILVTVHSKWSITFFKHLLPSLIRAVDEEGSKIARIYVEWLIAALVTKDMSLLEEVVLTPLRNSQEPRFVSSLGRAGLLIAKALGEAIPEDFLTQYLNVVIPLSTSNKAAIRHFSVAMIYAIHLDSQLEPLLDVALRQIVDGVSRCSESSDQFKNFKQGDDCIWNIHTEHTLEGICGGVITKLYHHNPLYTLKPGEIQLKDQHSSTKSASNLAKLAFMTTIRDAVLTENIQTKASTGEDQKRTELIVVASLCDIPVNLGGICRLSDALGVKLLTMNDLKVVKNSQFKSTCVTADRWQPMIEVKENNIVDYLLKMKLKGYTLIGLEQTDNSKMLEPSLKFPVKSLLLIGRERQGIPANLLMHLDFCVEIEQWGVVRSMNVQTATAVIVHAYNNQH